MMRRLTATFFPGNHIRSRPLLIRQVSQHQHTNTSKQQHIKHTNTSKYQLPPLTFVILAGFHLRYLVGK
nr:MAG: hypothetical protein DIU61_15205 [Bacteroidota bacterium]